MWDAELFGNIVKEVIKANKDSENPLKMDTLDKELARLVGYSPESIRKWRRKGNPGPSDDEAIKKLEERFGVSFIKDDVKAMEENDMTVTYSDFVKENILECYQIMRAFLDEMKGCAKEYFHILFTFENTCKAIEDRKIAIPKDTYDKIMLFVHEVFEPFTDDLDTILAPLHVPELEPRDKNGKLLPMTQEIKEKHIAVYEKLFKSYFLRLDEFAMKELYPILMR